MIRGSNLGSILLLVKTMPKPDRRSYRQRQRDANKRKQRSESEKARSDSVEGGTRLNRTIARAGICSRREADVLIEKGVVKVNGEVVTTLGVKVQEGDEVLVRGKRITRVNFEYILLNKPSDTITTVSDERGRRTVMDLLRGESISKAGMFPVGRLDRHTTGALLITNDGDLAYRLTHPKFEIEKIYRVRTANPLTFEQLEELRTGVELQDGFANVDRIEILPGKDGNEAGVSLHQGRNRQIRRMFEKIGSDVMRLERVKYAGLTTAGVRSGKWRRLTSREVTKLYKSVKL